MSTFWQGLLLVPFWKLAIIGLGLLVGLIMMVGDWRREALGYLAQGKKETIEILRLGPLCLKGLAWLWCYGREKAIAKWPRLGLKSDVFAWLAACSIAIGMTSVNLAIQNLRPPEIAPNIRTTWTTDKDWSEWELHGLEVVDGSLRLKNTGGQGKWIKLPDKSPLPVGWHKVAATQNSVWLDGGVSVVQIDLGMSEGAWIEHKRLLAPGAQVGAIWAKGHEAVVLSTTGDAVHWTGSAWEHAEYISKEDGEWLEAHCAFGDSWDDLWVGSRGAIFHREHGIWTMEVQPGSGIGPFTGITRDSKGLLAVNEEGSIWRRNSQSTSWRMAFNGPYHWAGVSSNGDKVVLYDNIGLSYELINDSPMSLTVGLKFRDVDRHIAVGVLDQGRNSVDLRNQQFIDGPTDDDLIDVSTTSATSAWAISGSAVYCYSSEPKYGNQGYALITVPRPANKALSLIEQPEGCRADVMFSSDGKFWQTDLKDVPGNDPYILIKISLMSNTTKKTPIIRAITLK